MNQGVPVPSNHTTKPPEEDLQSLLLEAERRNNEAYRRKGFAVTVVFWTTLVSVLIWATIVYFQYQGGSSEPQVKQSIPPEILEQTSTPGFDIFHPEPVQEGNQKPHAAAASATGQLIDQDDIRFTMQLMDFMHPSAKPKPKNDPEPQ